MHNYETHITNEHAKDLNAITLYDLNALGLLKVSGMDAAKLLQGQLTCDVEKITRTQSSLAALCNLQGRVISLFYLFLFQDAYYLLMPRAMVTLTLNVLKKYAVFYKVTLAEAHQELMLRGYHHATLPFIKENAHYALITLPNTSTRCILAGDPTIVQKTCDTLAPSLPLANLNAWMQLNIKENIPTLYPETSKKCLAHDLHLPQLNAVHFEKGCYTGQEIIARMHYRAKLKNHLYQANIQSSTPLLLGSDIYCLSATEKHVCGMLIDACHIKDDYYNTLIITDSAHAKNNHLFLNQDAAFFTLQMGSSS
jgi:folate-binding protein YgfZ